MAEMVKGDHFELNKKNWDRRTEIHLRSEFYDLAGFLEGKSSLNPPELALLGDVKGKRILHLQCHFGQDSISLARMGAIVTAIDLSPKAIAVARELAEKAGVSVRFIESNVYQLPEVLKETFDIVFTSYGVLTWLPDLEAWGKLVHQFLASKGQLILVEFHPLCWIFDDDFRRITYPYFNRGPLYFKENGSYTDGSEDAEMEYVAWNQPLSDVLGALLKVGLQLDDFQEYDYTPYNVFPDLVEDENGKFRFASWGDKFPFVYSIVATKQVQQPS